MTHRFLEVAQLLEPITEPWSGVAVFGNAVVLGDGEIYNQSFAVWGGACSRPPPPSFSRVQHPPRFEAVATIAHFWGQNYYHFVAENLVRLPLVLPVLDGHKDTVLHVQSRAPFVLTLLQLVGIVPARVVQGVVAADLAFLPQAVVCGNPSAVMLNLLRHTLIARMPPPDTSSPAQGGCMVLLVKRTGTRAVKNHDELLSELSVSFSENAGGGRGNRSCRIEVHTGNEPVPAQLLLFQRASAVVAPHGAGLVNMIACRAGTLIVELMVSSGDVNICYMTMANKLSLRHAMFTVPAATQHNQMTVDAAGAAALITEIWDTHMHHRGAA